MYTFASASAKASFVAASFALLSAFAFAILNFSSAIAYSSFAIFFSFLIASSRYASLSLFVYLSFSAAFAFSSETSASNFARSTVNSRSRLIMSFSAFANFPAFSSASPRLSDNAPSIHLTADVMPSTTFTTTIPNASKPRLTRSKTGLKTENASFSDIVASSFLLIASTIALIGITTTAISSIIGCATIVSSAIFSFPNATETFPTLPPKVSIASFIPPA